MTEPTTEAVQPSNPQPMGPIGWTAALGLLLALVSALVVSRARDIFPVRLKVQDISGVEGLYGTSGTEYLWLSIGAVIGLAGVAFIAVATIAKGIQLGRR